MSRVLGIIYPFGVEGLAAAAERAAAGRAEIRVIDSRDFDAIGPEVEALIGQISTKHAARAENLRWVQTSFAGVERLAPELLARGGVTLTNASGSFGAGISEFLLLYTLMMQKRALDYYEAQKKHEWRWPIGPAAMISESIVTVLGLGDLGGCYAKRMKALGATIRGVKRTAGEKPDFVDELYTTDEIDRALDGADIIALCLPNTDATEKMLSRERIFALKQGAIIVNAGRGNAIDQQALVEALNAGRVLAGLDVTVPEPLPADDPLWDAPNVFITPHISGPDAAEGAMRYFEKLAARNIEAYLDGRELENIVDLAQGY